MKIIMTCKEGWSFLSWQRVYFHDSTGKNITRRIVERLNREYPFGDDPHCESLVQLSSNGTEDCAFFISGESLCMEDISDAIEREYKYKIEIELVDGIY